MPASLIHLVRHGEVFNPDHVLYGRIPGFGLSELGTKMAEISAESKIGHPITRLYASPLQRAQESAAPWSKAFGLEVHTDERLIEPWNKFEGKTFEFGPSVVRHPRSWPWVINPFKPSWGEPYLSIASRMLAAIDDAWSATESGEVVLVSHQLPIWMVHRALAGQRLFHDPRKRRCSLSSITTLTLRQAQGPMGAQGAAGVQGPVGAQGAGSKFAEVDYQDPARELQASAIDLGAV